MIDELLATCDVAPAVAAAARACASALEPRDDGGIGARVHARVLRAFLDEGIADSDLAGTIGYGYDDLARERYESLLARYFRAEKVLARLSIVSGTHAIVAALAACAPPGALILAATGRPYDTLRNAIVTAPHSLAAQGVRYDEVALRDGRDVDDDALADACARDRPDVVFVQRSRGYGVRRSLDVAGIARVVAVVRATAPDAAILVDNCYGELVEDREPLEVGADLIMGSLIKNLGGGLAPTGGYVAGRSDLVDRVASRIYAPGLGAGLGPTLGLGRAFVQGLFYAPTVVRETLRSLRFAAALFTTLGFTVEPLADEPRTDIVQAIDLGDRASLLAFARGLQRAMPLNARFRPEPGPVPGYVDDVVMSSGSFVAGATIDLSCDAPLRPPFQMYLQGGVSAAHGALGSLLAADMVLREGTRRYSG
jgi:cystathionine beta-lyase family protein involved in aluminum resistance